MKICLKAQARRIQNSAACTVLEHPLNDELLDLAIANISGRYPDEKRVVNLKSSELAYVSEGNGKIVVNEQKHLLNVGDVVLIGAGEKYYWEGSMKLFLFCTPAWNKEQHSIVD